MDDNYVKILFRYHSDVLEEETVETMWATIVDEGKGLYKIDNIPFYGPLIASDDIVFAEYDNDEEILTYRHTVESSGNSVIQVAIINKTTLIEDVRNTFEALNCTSEKVNTGYFAMEIPVDVDYSTIKLILSDLEEKEVIEYAEPCLSKKHALDIDPDQ